MITPTTPTVASEIERYLRTGDSDPSATAWPGQTIMDSARQAHEDLSDALIQEIRRRTRSRPLPALPAGLDVVALTRRKVEPMIRGLFPRAEQDAVLTLVEQSVVFLTAENIVEILRGSRWRRSAWNLANLYLGALGTKPLGEGAPAIVGLSEGTTCYVSSAYFEDEDPFADFLVHEVAHVFHNCKRRTAGLHQTRRREWLLDIEFRKRETFAYSCEAYARLLEHAPRLRDRVNVARELGHRFQPADERVNRVEVVDIVLEASGRRNGWKVILARCAPRRPARGRQSAHD